MGKIKCIGCGAVIQTEDSKLPGYVPNEVLERNDLEHLVCQRCHKIKNYSAIMKNEMPIVQYYEIMQKITKTNSLFVYVVDLFNLEGSLNHQVIELLKGKDVILVANKRDLLPKSMKDGKIGVWLRNQVKKLGLRPKDVMLISVKNKYHLDDLLNNIENRRYGRDVYFLGATNVGKSSLINALIRSVGMLDYDLITTSVIPATTLNLIKIPMFSDAMLYDTPGLVNEDNLLSLVDAADFKTIMAKKEVKPGVYQLNSSQSLLISGFACFNYLKGDKNTFVTYFADTLPMQRSKLERALVLFPEKVKELFNFKTENLEYERHLFEVKEESDIVVNGLGFISIKSFPATIEVIAVKGCSVVMRDAICG